MTAALGTLAFLSIIWLLAVVTAMIVERSGGKILAALKGEIRRTPVETATIRIRYRPRPAQALRATPRLRAAA